MLMKVILFPVRGEQRGSVDVWVTSGGYCPMSPTLSWLTLPLVLGIDYFACLLIGTRDMNSTDPCIKHSMVSILKTCGCHISATRQIS